MAYLGITKMILGAHLVELHEIGLLLPSKRLLVELPGESDYSFINGPEDLPCPAPSGSRPKSLP